MEQSAGCNSSADIFTVVNSRTASSTRRLPSYITFRGKCLFDIRRDPRQFVQLQRDKVVNVVYEVTPQPKDHK